MPREIVENCDGGPWQPVVGWAHGAHVQVATVAEGERSIYWVLLGHNDEALAALGAQLRKAEAVTYEDDEQRARALLNTLDVTNAASGLYVSMDRHGLNRLIRLLRKARDAAFGRDE